MTRLTRLVRGRSPRHFAFVVSLSVHAVAVVCLTSLPRTEARLDSAHDASMTAQARSSAQPSANATDGDAIVVGGNSSRRGPTHRTDAPDSSNPRRVLFARGESDAVPASRADEDFESGAPRGWRMNRRGAASWFVYDSDTTPPSPSMSDHAFPFLVPRPPQGSYAAIADGRGPSRVILFRDITLDGRYRLHLTIFYVHAAGRLGSTATRDGLLSEEPHYRIDVVSKAGRLDSNARRDELRNIFTTTPDSPQRLDARHVAADLSAWEKQTVRLRISVAQHEGPMRAGIDDIRFELLP